MYKLRDKRKFILGWKGPA